jgi:hypothetical protein
MPFVFVIDEHMSDEYGILGTVAIENTLLTVVVSVLPNSVET